MNKAIELSPEMTAYVLGASEDLGPVAQRLIADTMALPEWGMQISADEAVFLRAMVRLVKPRRVLEVGTFTGLSSLVMASVLPPGGRVICLDRSDEFTAMARRAWAEAGVDDRIELIVGNAAESLAQLSGPIDMAFVDADKGNYRRYAEAIIPMLRTGGVLMADNTLWKQKVLGADHESDTEAIRSFNAWFVQHPQLDVEMVAIADGVSLGIKR